MVDKDVEIKVLKGTIIKVADHPVKLKESLYITQIDDNTFRLKDHTIMEEKGE